MLRRAVAATNCARAGKASGLDMGGRRLCWTNLIRIRSICPRPFAQIAQAEGDRQRVAQNSVINRRTKGTCPASHCRAKPEAREFFARDQIESRTKRRL